jgi:superfamily II DNA or RNA helicase
VITQPLVEQFLAGVTGQALREGTRYAQQARVGSFVGSAESVATVVSGKSVDFEVVLWSEGGALRHRCECPSWRDPCKHEVAAALMLRQAIGGEKLPAEAPSKKGAAPVDPRVEALNERIVAARRDRLKVRLADAAPCLIVESPSGYAYRVHLRGRHDGPHSCDCPDFEANRLHSCKHVERVRSNLRNGLPSLPPAWRQAAARPSVYLHFGEVVEPRLFGRPTGPGARTVAAAFDDNGGWLPPLASDPAELRERLAHLGASVEPEALAWLDRRIARRPVLPDLPPAKLLPPTPLKPHPYQIEGAMFLARAGRALLADDMGLGKTLQAILAACVLRRAATPVKHVTIVCPASLRSGWREEIRRWIGEEVVLLEGNPETRARTIALRPPWLVTHYEQVLRDHPAHAAHAPDLLILDEAQRAKGLTAQTSRAVKAIDARHVFALTGTPLENRLEEAYAIAQLVDQRLLPPLWQVDRDHFQRDEKGRRVVAYRNLDALRSKLQPAFLRRRKEDVALQLPDRVRSVAFVEMHPDVEATYEDVMQQVRRIASKPVLLPADLERMQRLLIIARRACNGPHMLGLEVDDRKVPKLAELRANLEDLCLGEGRKVVVFSEWTDMTDRVEEMCRRLKLPAFHLKGSVPLRRRGGLIDAFREQAGPAVFISTDAGGVGLNLQVADAVVNLDVPWSPARLEQRIARVHRIGSKRTVNEILIVTKERLEHRILEQHATKKAVLANVWASDGDDVVAAPGGSGAFREIVKELLRTEAPPDVRREMPHEELVASARSPTPMLPAQVAEPRATHVPRGTVATASRQAPIASRTDGLDIETLARAVASVAPTLPAEHRQSLATVFRALADALGN